MSKRQDAIDDANARINAGSDFVDAVNTAVIDHQLNNAQISQVAWNVANDQYSGDAGPVVFDDTLTA